MDLRKLKTLIDLVSESNVSELEITEAEGKVRIVKGSGPAVQAASPQIAISTARNEPSAGGCGGTGGRGPFRPHRQVTHGGHLLPVGQPGRQGLR